MDYFLTLAIIGLAALGMAWMPSLSNKFRISYGILYVFLGMLVYSVFNHIPRPDPFVHQKQIIQFTEFIVIVAIMGTGLKIDQPFSLRGWSVPLRMVSIGMIASMALIFFTAWYFFKMDIASAILLAAVLAPTDPVLASDVQVGPPLEPTKDNVRFTLTAEGGMNDGTAFPFVWLAIAFGLAAAGKDVSFSDWLIRDVAYKIIMGVVFGILLGRFLAYLLFTLPKKGMFKMVNEGFVALSATLLVYGLTQLADAYGFIAVFVAAVTVRNYEMSHEYHKIMHAFMDQVERIMVAIGLLIFGGGLLNGLLSSLTVPLAILGVIIIFLIRPLSGQLALIGTDLHANEKWAISFFGIKGMGSFYYLAFALEQTTFRYQYQIWSLVSFIVLLSIVVHGMSSNTVMRKISKRFSFR